MSEIDVGRPGYCEHGNDVHGRHCWACDEAMIDRLESEVERERLANENVTALLTRANAEVERLTRERDEMKRCADSAETRWEEVAKLALERERLVFASEARAEKAERERDEAILRYVRAEGEWIRIHRAYDVWNAEAVGLREALRRRDSVLIGLARYQDVEGGQCWCGSFGLADSLHAPWCRAARIELRAALSEGAKGG